MSHTPGPWKIFQSVLDSRLQVDVRDSTETPVCGVDAREHVYAGHGAQKDADSRCEVGQPETWANARLIAAAPDLLEALKKAAQELGVNDPRDLAFESDLSGEIRAAIAKAEGK